MNRLQALIYNDGERLVPYVSHGEGELVRHRSSYAFFHTVIAADLRDHAPVGSQVSIVDLGFGSGYGCALLSSLPSSEITGVDVGRECAIFARQYYSRTNVDYVIEDLTTFIPRMSPYDYAVSRGVLEHVPNGLSLIGQIKFTRRLMIDVPYDESPGNEHHVLTGIREDAFRGLDRCELFYEDLEGAIYDASRKPDKPNMIMAVLSSRHLPSVSGLFDFPIAPVRSDELETAGRATACGRRYEYDSAVEFLSAVDDAIKETEVVADIGCGIAPMRYFRPKLHLLIEPWKEYADVLSSHHAGDKSVVILRNGALEALRQLADNSVDSVFLLDVIEHVDRADGYAIISEMERVAREQVVVFTPLGYMPQHLEPGEPDGWGLSGVEVQRHRSGWMPEDFTAGWSLHVCKDFHKVDHKGRLLAEPVGAFYAIRNFERKTDIAPANLPDLRRPLPAEKALQELQVEHRHLQAYCAYLKESNDALLVEHQQLLAVSQQQQAQLAGQQPTE